MKKVSFRSDVLPLKNGLYRLALRITLSREEAEDVVQDTMLRVWNRRDTWDRIENIEAFCYTICRNLALDRIKASANKNLSIDSSPLTDTAKALPRTADSSYRADPERQAEQRDKIDAVRRIMSRLPEKQRSAMHLRDFEQKSYKEIATILDISEDQVKVSIFRARQTIKKLFSKAEQYGL